MISRDESRPDIRYMYPIKSSLAPEGPAIAFSFKEHGGIVWHGKYDLNTAELMDSITVKTTKRERARAKLVQLLEHEDRPAKEVYAGLADIGVGSRTVEKAKKRTPSHNLPFWRKLVLEFAKTQITNDVYREMR